MTGLKPWPGGVWGQASTAHFMGSGSPVGVVTPTGEGDLYVDKTTPALWQATGTESGDWQSVGGGGGGSLTLQSSTDETAFADNPITANADGGIYESALILAAPPSWLDDEGNITQPGMYQVGVNITSVTPDTTPGLWAFAYPGAVLGDKATEMFNLDQLPTDEVTYHVTFSVTEADLPFGPVSWWAYMPTDAEPQGQIQLGTWGTQLISSS